MSLFKNYTSYSQPKTSYSSVGDNNPFSWYNLFKKKQQTPFSKNFTPTQGRSSMIGPPAPTGYGQKREQPKVQGMQYPTGSPEAGYQGYLNTRATERRGREGELRGQAEKTHSDYTTRLEADRQRANEILRQGVYLISLTT